MYIKSEICTFVVNTAGKTSGERIVKPVDGIVDIDEFLECLKDKSKYVIICLEPSNAETTKQQYFNCVDELVPEDGYESCYVFAMYGRNLSQAMTRKMVMNFKGKGKEAEIKVNYYAS